MQLARLWWAMGLRGQRGCSLAFSLLFKILLWMAAIAHTNNPSPSSYPQAWEGLPETGTCQVHQGMPQDGLCRLGGRYMS